MMVKWIFDRSVSLMALVGLLPVMAVIAATIWISSPGYPVFFTQKRVGRLGRTFKIYKFRTMYPGNEYNHVSVKGEKRITRIGSFLRRYKLDELPELLNILMGEMSFVGPRPDVPGYADCLEGEERKILLLRPGLTGPATLKYRNEEILLQQKDNPVEYNDNVLWPDKVRINLLYYYNRSFAMDIKIIFQTIFTA